jgi:hypothetical protein
MFLKISSWAESELHAKFGDFCHEALDNCIYNYPTAWFKDLPCKLITSSLQEIIPYFNGIRKFITVFTEPGLEPCTSLYRKKSYVAICPKEDHICTDSCTLTIHDLNLFVPTFYNAASTPLFR